MSQHAKADRFGLIRILIYSGSIIVYLLSDIVGLHSLNVIVSVCAIASILIALPKLGKIGVTLSALFLFFGFFVLIYHHVPAAVYLTSFGGMFNQLALFAIIPILAIPIKVGGYGPAIQQLLEGRIKSPSQLYRTISFYSYILSCFMNLATLPMIYSGVQNTLESYPLKQRKRFAANGIVHGFAIPILWTPVAPIVGVVVDLTHVKWLKLFPFLLILSIAALLLDWIIYRFARSKYEILDDHLVLDSIANKELAASVFTQGLSSASKKQLKQLVLAVLGFISLIIFVEQWLSIGLMSTVIMLTIPFALLWSTLVKRTIPFIKEGINHFYVQLPKMSDQFAIFLSAGFFVTVVQVTGNNIVVNHFVSALADSIGSHWFLMILPFIPLALAFVGMHPALAISLLAGSLTPASLGITSEQLAIALLGGAVSTFMLGPFNATSGVMSSIMKVTTFQIVRWNTGYTFSFLALIIFVLFVS